MQHDTKNSPIAALLQRINSLYEVPKTASRNQLLRSITDQCMIEIENFSKRKPGEPVDDFILPQDASPVLLEIVLERFPNDLFDDLEYGRTIVALHAMLMSANIVDRDPKSGAEYRSKFFLCISNFLVSACSNPNVSAREKIDLLQPFQYSLPYWKMMRRLMDPEVPFPHALVSTLFVLVHLAMRTNMGSNILTWMVLLGPAIRFAESMSESNFTKKILKAAVAREPELTDRSARFHHLKWIHETWSIAKSALLPLLATDDQLVLNEIASMEGIRNRLIEKATGTEWSHGMELRLQAMQAQFLAHLLRPPKNRSNAQKMNLWKQRISMFEVDFLVNRAVSLIELLTIGFDSWKKAANLFEKKGSDFRAPWNWTAVEPMTRCASAFFFEALMGAIFTFESSLPVRIAMFDILHSLSCSSEHAKSLKFVHKRSGLHLGEHIMAAEIEFNLQNAKLASVDPAKAPLWQRMLLHPYEAAGIVTAMDNATACMHVIQVIPEPFVLACMIARNVCPPKFLKTDAFLTPVKEFVDSIKSSGNERYTKGVHHFAVELYTNAIELLQLDDPALACVLYSNRCQANIELQRGADALRDAKAALRLDPEHEKSLRRKRIAQSLIANRTKPKQILTVNGTTWCVGSYSRWDGPFWNPANGPEPPPPAAQNESSSSGKASSPPNAETSPKKQHSEKKPRDKEEPESGKGQCSICLDAKSDHAMVPCGHTFCGGCCAKLSECALCRTKINMKIKIFL